MRMQRREFLKAIGAVSATAAVPGCATMGGGAQGKVVVVGGGYGGATAAKYIRMWSNGDDRRHRHRAERRVHLVPAVESRARRLEDRSPTSPSATTISSSATA